MGPLIVPQENLILGYLYALNITITEVIRLKEYNLTGNMKKKTLFFFKTYSGFLRGANTFQYLGRNLKHVQLLFLVIFQS